MQEVKCAGRLRKSGSHAGVPFEVGLVKLPQEDVMPCLSNPLKDLWQMRNLQDSLKTFLWKYIVQCCRTKEALAVQLQRLLQSTLLKSIHRRNTRSCRFAQPNTPLICPAHTPLIQPDHTPRSYAALHCPPPHSYTLLIHRLALPNTPLIPPAHMPLCTANTCGMDQPQVDQPNRLSEGLLVLSNPI
eukprot:scaffold215023_cov17-Tisochrysis_lutea.AAC.1